MYVAEPSVFCFQFFDVPHSPCPWTQISPTAMYGQVEANVPTPGLEGGKGWVSRSRTYETVT